LKLVKTDISTLDALEDLRYLEIAHAPKLTTGLLIGV